MKKCLLAVLILTSGLYVQAQTSFKSGDKYGLKDNNGNILLSPKYDFISDFKEGYAKMYLNNKCGLIDQKGKEIVPAKYIDIEDLNSRLVAIRSGTKWGLVDKMGGEILAPIYTYIFGFGDGPSLIELDDKIGLINEAGEIIVAPKYGSILDFKDGLAEVELNDKWGLIDKTGKEIVPPRYEFIDAFKQGLAEVRLDSTHFTTIDKTGKEIGPIKVVQKQERSNTNCNCPPPTKDDFAELCIAINESEAAEIGPGVDYKFSHKYQEVLWRISCADPQKDSLAVARIKIQCMWNKYRTQFRCRDVNATIPEGNVAKYSIDCGRTTFLTEAIKRYQLDMNFIDPADGETLMDFLQKQRKRFLEEIPTINSQVREYNRYYHLFKKSGAKHAKQLLPGK